MRSAFIFTIFILSALVGKAQVKTDSQQSDEFYVKKVLLGPGVQVDNIKYTGMTGGIGQFEANPKLIGVRSGLVFSTGNVDSIQGPNNSPGFTSTGKLPDSKEAIKELKRGDRDLNKLCKRRTTDIAVLEFDFVPVKNSLEFNYVFASEEYPEYAGSAFNDVFGFFLSGPGIRKKVNLAVVPGEKKPVAINTINHRKNSAYYRSNTGQVGRLKKLFASKKKLKEIKELHDALQFDGLTKVLKVHYDVIPYQLYHIKIAIADASDQFYDSAVFLEAGSFVSVVDTSGKHYATLKKLENKKAPDVDSIFHRQVIAPPEKEEMKEETIDDHMEITDVFFDIDKINIPDSSKERLDKLVTYLDKHKTLICSILGYTDSTGSKRYNDKLSERRALAVKAYLEDKGVEPRQLTYAGGGWQNPVLANTSEKGRRRNRRVELILENP